MKLRLSFKVHLYSSFRYYLYYLIILALSLILKFTLKIDSGIYLGYIMISAFLFSIILGVFEYLIVLHTYLNFQPNPRAFWIQSIFANVINSLICVVITLLFNVILFITTDFHLLFSTIPPLFILYLFGYGMGSLGYVFLHNIKHLTIILIIVLLVALVFFGQIFNGWLVLLIAYYGEHYIIWIILLGLTIISEAIIILRLKRFIK